MHPLRHLVRTGLAAGLLGLSTLLPATQPGSPDTTFRSGSGPNGIVRCMALQKDGKIMIGGEFTTVQSYRRNRICRLLSNGNVDPSFNPGSGTGVDGMVHAIAIQSDGKVIIAGEFSSYNGIAVSRIVRLNTDGSVDIRFDPGSSTMGNIYSLALQPDGKIIAGGNFTSFSGQTRGSLVRLNSDGSVDTTYAVGSGVSGTVKSMALQKDGALIIGGSFSQVDGVSRPNVARLTILGALDATFDPGSGADASVNAVALRADGKVMIGGAFQNYDTFQGVYVARLNTDGTLDSTFASGLLLNGPVNALAVLTDGKTYVAGEFFGDPINSNFARGRMARLNADGTRDSSFDVGFGVDQAVHALVVQADKRVIAAGAFRNVNGKTRQRIARFSTAGALDAGFNMPAGVSGYVSAVAATRDGRVLIGGSFSMYAGVSRNGIARLTSTGTLDTSFNPGTGFNNVVNALAALPDGKVLVGGSFGSFNGVTRGQLARLNSNGTLDTTFDPGASTNGPITGMCLQPDGKIIIVGSFSSYQGISRNGIARLNADATLDTSFTPGSGANLAVLAVALQADGKILIGGIFTSYAGVTRGRVARLNSDGTLDTAFEPASTGADGSVLAIAAQPDGRVIIGGSFTAYDGTPRERIARLRADGTLNAVFDVGDGVDGDVHCAQVQPDEKILIGGAFTTYNNTSSPGIARLNPDGSIDDGFNPGDGTGTVMAMALQPDGKALIGGSFSVYDGQSVDGVARVLLHFTHVATTFRGTAFSLESVNAALMGSVTITTATNGFYTGSLATGTETVPLSGAFDREGRSLATATRKDRSVIHLSLVLTKGSGGSPVVGGTLVDYAGRTSSLEAHAPYFSTSTRPANFFAGTYNVALEGPASAQALLPVSGAGYLICKVSSSGTSTVTGRMPDGSAVSGAPGLNQSGALLMHLPLYAGKGFINGSMMIDSSYAGKDGRPVTGSVLWLRPAGAPYASGIVQTQSITGRQYMPAISSEPPFGSTMPGDVDVLIQGGHLPVAGGPAAEMSFSLSGVGIVAAGGTINALKINMNRSTGMFTGSFIPTGATKAVALQGLIINGSDAVGYTLITLGGETRPSRVGLALP